MKLLYYLSCKSTPMIYMTLIPLKGKALKIDSKIMGMPLALSGNEITSTFFNEQDAQVYLDIRKNKLYKRYVVVMYGENEMAKRVHDTLYYALTKEQLAKTQMI